MNVISMKTKNNVDANALIDMRYRELLQFHLIPDFMNQLFEERHEVKYILVYIDG